MGQSDSGNNPGKRHEAFGAYYFRVDLTSREPAT